MQRRANVNNRFSRTQRSAARKEVQKDRMKTVKNIEHQLDDVKVLELHYS